ncbi:MAG: GntR family transcriptional regulator [Lachnospiraceae bacterium]|nr:GntR family transcriptional regulator [Lachnospiraceae bacterium]
MKEKKNDIAWEHLTISTNDYLPLRDVVFQTIRQGILHGVLPPGQRLMEIQLAKHLGVSRTPVREALRMLELEGLVVTIPRHGAEVAEITQKDLQDVLEVRCALEALAVDLACMAITEEELQSLRANTDKFGKLIESGNISALAECDVAFHDIIFSATHNNRLVQLLSNLSEQMYRYRLEYLKDKEVHPVLLQEHKEIITHLEKRDTTKAKEVITRHINKQYEDVIKNLKKVE